MLKAPLRRRVMKTKTFDNRKTFKYKRMLLINGLLKLKIKLLDKIWKCISKNQNNVMEIFI